MRRSAAASAALLLLLALPACSRERRISCDDPRVAAYLEWVLPTRVEVLRSLTRATTVGDGRARGIEVALAAYDKAGYRTRCVGTFLFELYQTDAAGADRVGRRVSAWPVSLDADGSMAAYWDALAQMYRFPLQLEGGALPAAEYVLLVRHTLPDGSHLEDRGPFTVTE